MFIRYGLNNAKSTICLSTLFCELLGITRPIGLHLRSGTMIFGKKKGGKVLDGGPAA
jgi:hypothetical protein